MKQDSQLGRGFRRLWLATGVSSVGDGMVLVAFPLLALTLTHDPVVIAGLVAVEQAPALLVALPAGVMADRRNRRSLILATEITRFIALAVFGACILAGADSLPLIFVTAFLLGALSVSFEVLSGACLPDMVEEEQLVPANTKLMTALLAGREMVGQAAGGAVFALASSIPFLADAVSFVGSAVLLRSAVADKEPAPAESSAWADLRGGLRWFSRQPVLRLLAGIIATLAFCQAAVFGVMVLYATTRLHLHGAGYGLLLAAAATGTLIASPLAPRLHRRIGSAACIIGAAVIAGVAYPVLAVTHSAVVAGFMLMVEALSVVVGNAASRSVRQSTVPAEMQGRAAAAYQTLILVSLPLGALAGGLATSAVGIPDAFAAAGGFQLLVIAALGPRLAARMAPVVDLRPEETGAIDLRQQPGVVPEQAA